MLILIDGSLTILPVRTLASSGFRFATLSSRATACFVCYCFRLRLKSDLDRPNGNWDSQELHLSFFHRIIDTSVSPPLLPTTNSVGALLPCTKLSR